MTNTLILSGHVIQDGLRFLWWVIDGQPSRLTVSHPVHGTRTSVLKGDPEELARRLASQILAKEPNALPVRESSDPGSGSL